MLRPSPTLLAALLLALGSHAARAQAAPAPEPLVAVAQAVPGPALLRQAVPLGRQAVDAPVSLALTLPLRNPGALRALLYRLYDRHDPSYGHYLTGGQFDQRFAPTAADYQVVADFARARGLTVYPHAGRTVVGISGTSGAVEGAFGVHLNRYRLPGGRVAYANDAAPQVPAAVASRLGAIVGLDTLAQPRPALRRRDAGQLLANAAPPIGSDPSGGLTPADIHALYNLNSIGLQGEGQSQALVELDGYNLSDIDRYNAQFSLGVNTAAVLSNVYVGGFTGTAGANQTEVVLDIDMMLALAPKTARIYSYEASNSASNLLAVETQIADDNLAKSVSCSWGLAETVLEAGSTPAEYGAYFSAEDTEFQKMAAQGQSFFTSAGDAGAYDDGSTVSVDDPAGQPYVTAVGGTSLSATGVGTSQLAYLSETTWNDGPGSAGGGGISIVFPKPYYQYTNPSMTSPSGPLGVSPTMRDLPDVSLDADPNTGYAIYVASESTTGFIVVGGTSAAAPLWAAFSTLVNEARATGATTAPTTTPGVPTTPLGFANPLIYQIGTGTVGNYANDFHDIADGSTNLFYHATPGYDDATGWGTYNGAYLLADLAAAGSGTGFSNPFSHTFAAGLQMISEPFDFSRVNTNFAGLFGLTLPVPTADELVLYQPLFNAYAYYPAAPADTLRPGVGYWLRVPTDTSVSRVGAIVASPLQTTLQTGWNQIGDPFLDAVPFTDIIVTRVGTASESGALGVTSKALVSPVLYTYGAGDTAYTAVSGSSAAISPFTGYWVYAFAPVTLTFHDPARIASGG